MIGWIYLRLVASVETAIEYLAQAQVDSNARFDRLQSKVDRNARIMSVLWLLRGIGFSREEAMRDIADTIDVDYETARSAVRKVEYDRPFK